MKSADILMAQDDFRFQRKTEEKICCKRQLNTVWKYLHTEEILKVVFFHRSKDMKPHSVKDKFIDKKLY